VLLLAPRGPRRLLRVRQETEPPPRAPGLTLLMPSRAGRQVDRPARGAASGSRVPRAALVAAALLAATGLGLQVTLTRLFSFLYWYHAAFLVVGIGLLGLGAGGAILARRGIEGEVDALSLAAGA